MGQEFKLFIPWVSLVISAFVLGRHADHLCLHVDHLCLRPGPAPSLDAESKEQDTEKAMGSSSGPESIQSAKEASGRDDAKETPGNTRRTRGGLATTATG